MGKKLIIRGADFSENGIHEGEAVCILEETKIGYFINSSGQIKNFSGPPAYCNIDIYRVTNGATYIMHGPTPSPSAYGIMAKLTKVNVQLNETYELYAGPQRGQDKDYTFEFVAKGNLVGLNDNEYETGYHAYIEAKPVD